jgi:hypothetical protein
VVCLAVLRSLDCSPNTAEQRNRANLRPLTAEQILAWADAHFELTETWPNQKSGPVHGNPGETWLALSSSLDRGLRNLPGGSSLAKLLEENRGVRNSANLPLLTEDQILAWADAHQRRTKRWPTQYSGSIIEAPGETWTGINSALRRGYRGLPGDSSLAQLLAERSGVRNRLDLPPLSVDQVLAWADAHFQRTGEWPKQRSGPIFDASGETWLAVNHYLSRGTRGLPGGSSLARLIKDNRRCLD